MHPTRAEIRSLLDGTQADPATQSKLDEHLQKCEFCADIAAEERLILQEVAKSAGADLSSQAFGERLYAQLHYGTIVNLKPLGDSKSESQTRIAAHTPETNTPRVESLLTLFSEKPEFVLNVMRDNSAQKDYLQLISDDPQNVSQVLVRIPQLDTELLTDTLGHANLPEQLHGDPAAFNWQVKFPTAVFDLEPMIYDPEKVEFSKEVELESDKQDRIQVTFQRKTEGAQVIIKVLELDGKTQPERVRVVLTQEDTPTLIETDSQHPATFDINDHERTINIRLFS